MRVDQDVAMYPSISGLVAEYIVAIDVTRVRFPADAIISIQPCCSGERDNCSKGMLALHLPGVCYSYVAMVSGPVAMDKSLVFGTKDCRLESCQGQVLWFSSRLAPSFPEQRGPLAVLWGRRDHPLWGSSVGPKG